ncbi:hypothetical protein PG996_013673 [Apiospora saccharicola]|uniref:Rhodopsin domain-containing protein n=1 Tax=Apiospora saccharicola TaxID=335842 RepID=A0ABR1U641_9PEZI
MADPAAPIPPSVAFSDMPENWLTNPDGLAIACLTITIVLALFAILVVGLRIYARHAIDALGIDDGFMVVATCLFVANSVLCCLDCFAGLGSRDEKVLANPWNGPAATMYLVLWQITYAWSLPFIKCSICFSLFRFTNERRHTIPLWCVMILATFSAMLGFVAVLITCQPIARNWDPALSNVGSCMDYSIIQNISYFISASSIITDWACAILPCFIVWNLNIKRKLKVSVAVVLALGAVASLSTIVRLPYLGAYTAPVDHYYKIANIVIWSEIECGVGIIAGSLPSLRGFFKYIRDKSSAGSSKRQHRHLSLDDNENSHHFVTIGGTGSEGDRTAAAASNLRLGNLGCSASNSTTCEAGGGTSSTGDGVSRRGAHKGEAWVDLEDSEEDSESQKRMIRRTHGYSVQVQSTHGQGRGYAT